LKEITKKMKLKNIVKSVITLISAIFGLMLVMQSSPGNAVSAKSDGSAIYQQHCASCHGGDGKANTAKGKRKGATDLTKSAISTVRGIKVIANGREQMPAFKGSLTDDEISNVMEFVRGFRR
jgi:cytochrome c6